MATKEYEVRLDKPEHWTLWYKRYRNAAEAAEIMDFVNPDAKDLSSGDLREPNEPDFLSGGTTTSTTGANTPQTDLSQTVPIQPTIRPEDKRLEFDLYKMKMARYDTRKRAIQELYSWVNRTVAVKYTQHLDYDRNLAKYVSEIKQRVAPNNVQHYNLVQDRYRQSLDTSRRTNPEVWINNWEIAYMDAKAVNIPDIDGDNAVMAFLGAAAKFAPTWAELHSHDLENKQQLGQRFGLSLDQLGAMFQNKINT